MDWEKAVKKESKIFEIPSRWLHIHYFEALTILFRIENALRVFVYSILKQNHFDKWADLSIQISDTETTTTIAALSRKRMNQVKMHGYLGYDISCPMMYLNSGEIIRLVTETYWDQFHEFFKGSKDIIKNKLDEINTIRNSLAHFRPLKEDDIEVLKQNAKHALLGVEKYLSDMVTTYHLVPTNTNDEWYIALSTIGTELCTVSAFYDKSEQWIRIHITYACPKLRLRKSDTSRIISTLNLNSDIILKRYNNITKFITYECETIPYMGSVKDVDSFNITKSGDMVFSSSVFKSKWTIIIEDIKSVLSEISRETDLIKNDNLARGNLIEPVYLGCYSREGSSTWTINTDNLRCKSQEDSPTEYWESIEFGADFISSSTNYPWTPSSVSDFEFPF